MAPPSWVPSAARDGQEPRKVGGEMLQGGFWEIYRGGAVFTTLQLQNRERAKVHPGHLLEVGSSASTEAPNARGQPKGPGWLGLA